MASGSAPAVDGVKNLPPVSSAIRLSSDERIAASKYSLSPADARVCRTPEPRSVPFRCAVALTSYMPASSATKDPLYSPSLDTVHSSGTSIVLPEGDFTCATTWASLTSVNVGSTISPVSLTDSPGSTRSTDVVTSTGSGTPSTSQRTSLRQNVACVVSSTAIEASIFQIQESWTENAIDLPRP